MWVLEMICVKKCHFSAKIWVSISFRSFWISSLIVEIANKFSFSVGICLANFTRSEIIKNFSIFTIQSFDIADNFRDEIISLLVFSKVETSYLNSINSRPTSFTLVKYCLYFPFCHNFFFSILSSFSKSKSANGTEGSLISVFLGDFLM